MAKDECNKRKKWKPEETLGLLRCYMARKDEFQHVRKKKFAYSNILKDMISQGVTDSRTSITALEGKMRTLLAAYKSAKDNPRQTGATPCIPPYFEELEEIFGSEPLISNSHTLHFGKAPISQADEEYEEVEFLFEPIEVPKSPEEDPDLPSTSAAVRSIKRKSPRESYYSAKLQLKKKTVEDKLAQRAKYYRAMLNSFHEKWRQEAEILKDAENKKISPLEKILNKKP